MGPGGWGTMADRWCEEAGWFPDCFPGCPRRCSNWGNWVAAAGLTGGRVNKFNVTKQSPVSKWGWGRRGARGGLTGAGAGDRRTVHSVRLPSCDRSFVVLVPLPRITTPRATTSGIGCPS